MVFVVEHDQRGGNDLADAPGAAAPAAQGFEGGLEQGLKVVLSRELAVSYTHLTLPTTPYV